MRRDGGADRIPELADEPAGGLRCRGGGAGGGTARGANGARLPGGGAVLRASARGAARRSRCGLAETPRRIAGATGGAAWPGLREALRKRENGDTREEERCRRSLSAPRRREEESALVQHHGAGRRRAPGCIPNSVVFPPGGKLTGDTREEERCRRSIEHRTQGGGKRPMCHNTGRREESARCMRSGLWGRYKVRRHQGGGRCRR